MKNKREQSDCFLPWDLVEKNHSTISHKMIHPSCVHRRLPALLIYFSTHNFNLLLFYPTMTESTYCIHCLSDPCLWHLYCRQISEECQMLENNQTESIVDEEAARRYRFHAYKTFVRIHHGYLGRSRRVKIPQCVLLGIHDLWPDVDNNYTGHRASNTVE